MERDDASVAQRIRDFIRATLVAAHRSRLVINLSGGVDSALSAALALQAVGPEQFFVALMPNGELGSQSVRQATLVVEALRIPQDHVFQFDIQGPVDAIAGLTVAPDQVRRGNIMARVRMILLFDLAKRLDALVCGTENRTEHYLGYFTRFGDAASDLEPIGKLYKTQVWELARALGIPAAIIEQAPTAGLWEAQTDEGEFGFSYHDADIVLARTFDDHLGVDEIVARGMPRETVVAVLERVASNDFKHHLPYMAP